MAHKEKCFRCNARTPQGLYVTIARRGSAVDSQTHPLCAGCAVDFWRWADEMRTMMAYQSVMSAKEALRNRERRLRKREANVRVRERRLIERAGNKKLELLARAH